MLTRSQQILLKRTQREAGLSDDDYREALVMISGCRSSKDPDMTNVHLDALLAYFEAIYWRAVDLGQLQAAEKPHSVFRQRDFWKGRNKAGDSSRDRFTHLRLKCEIEQHERGLTELGYGLDYLVAIKEKVTHGRTDSQSLHHYRVALERTLKAKQKKLQPIPSDNPF